MKNIEYIETERIKELQNKRFCDTFKKLIEIPYYRRKLDACRIDINNVKTLNDISILPFTTKEDLIACYPNSATACSISKIAKYHFTSGTTGRPLAIGYTRSDIKTMSKCLARLLRAAGVTSRSIVLNAYNYGLFSGGLSFHEAICEMGATAIPSSVGNDDRQIVLLKDFAVDTLCTTPSYALHLANKINSRDVNSLSLKRCICGAEPWSDNMRSAIEDLLHVEAYDVYGLTEMGVGVGYSCKFKEGLHICEDCFYVEIVDPTSGKNISDESVGELVITSLAREGVPLIRYKTGDLTHFILQPCRCGRTHRRIARIIGRADDMLIVKGVNIYPLEIENFVHSIVPLRGSNVEILLETVDSLDRLTLHIDVTKTILNDENLRIRTEDMFRRRFGIKAMIAFVETKVLQQTKKIYVRDLRCK